MNVDLFERIMALSFSQEDRDRLVRVPVWVLVRLAMEGIVHGNDFDQAIPMAVAALESEDEAMRSQAEDRVVS